MGCDDDEEEHDEEGGGGGGSGGLRPHQKEKCLREGEGSAWRQRMLQLVESQRVAWPAS